MLANIQLLATMITKPTGMLMHVIYRVCDVCWCISATYAVYELPEDLLNLHTTCFRWVLKLVVHLEDLFFPAK